MKKKKVAIIGSVGVPANYGGFETLCQHLVENLNDKYDLTVYCSAKKYPAWQRQPVYKGAKLVYLPLDANGIQSIPYDSLSILHALFFSDVLLILGVAGAWLLPFVRLFTRKKIIISIDGMEWKRDKWSLLAKWYLFWAESLAVRYSHFDISDNEAIQDYTAMRYGTLSRIIEYGGDHGKPVKALYADKLKYPFLGSPYAVKVCRIEPENNVHLVLEAFAAMPGYRLVLVGNWNNSLYGQNLKEQYGSCKNLFLLDPIYDQKQLDLIRSNALLYIHGHSAGGTNPSLVEAMCLGLPVMAFSVSYNRTTTEGKALYFKTAQELNQLIQNMPLQQLLAMGPKMKEIASRRYLWGKITEKYDLLIKESLEAKTKTRLRPKVHQLENRLLIDLAAGHLRNPEYFFEKQL